MTAPARHRQADIDRAVKIALRNGLRVTAIDMAAGRVEVASQDATQPQLTLARDPAERARERRAKRWSGGAG